jgi:integrase
LAGVAGLVRRGGACPEPRASSLFCVEEMLSLRWTLGGAPGRSAGSASLHGSGGRGRGGGQSSGVGSGEDPQARVVRMPRSVAEEVAASLAARPHSPEVLVFTAPLGGPLSRADFVRNCFKPAVLAANEAIAKPPKDRRPAALPDGLRFYDLRHTCASLLIPQGASIKAVQAQLGACDRQHHPRHLRAPVPVRDGGAR